MDKSTALHEAQHFSCTGYRAEAAPFLDDPESYYFKIYDTSGNSRNFKSLPAFYSTIDYLRSQLGDPQEDVTTDEVPVITLEVEE